MGRLHSVLSDLRCWRPGDLLWSPFSQLDSKGGFPVGHGRVQGKLSFRSRKIKRQVNDIVGECGEGAQHISCQAEGRVVASRKACSPSMSCNSGMEAVGFCTWGSVRE